MFFQLARDFKWILWSISMMCERIILEVSINRFCGKDNITNSRKENILYLRLQETNWILNSFIMQRIDNSSSFLPDMICDYDYNFSKL